MPRTHYLSDEQVHYRWDIDNEPLLTIAPTNGAASRQVAAGAAA
jgi:hypothetical protein